MATSTPEDAPHGMEFLYSLKCLNVATSRARCACVLVCSPRLFEPDCKTPRQMRLANALCRYRESAREVEAGNCSPVGRDLQRLGLLSWCHLTPEVDWDEVVRAIRLIG